ncbi:MAG: DNA cytosine methyltransferase [Pseudomonadota bacterium]
MNHKNSSAIPVIDLFAGPGGLGEGFASIGKNEGKDFFRIRLSVEKNPSAHATLLLRSFFRQFPHNNVPSEYYAFLRGEISLDDMFIIYPAEAERAREEVWCAELGSGDEFNLILDEKIEHIIKGKEKWVLIGGPPCQAYSVMGRSRNKGIKGYKPEKDKHHFLYREYLRIIAKHKPAVFVMENVKGILSSKISNNLIFDQILYDLKNPSLSIAECTGEKAADVSYEVFSFVNNHGTDLFGNRFLDSKDFVIQSEKYGIPQSRHRVIILGIRTDFLSGEAPDRLKEEKQVPLSKVLSGLPRIRSGLSNNVSDPDTKKNWYRNLMDLSSQQWFCSNLKEENQQVYDLMVETIKKMRMPHKDRGAEFISCPVRIKYRPEWYLDNRIGGVCNHSSKSHIIKDLHRYLYAACFSKIEGRSPRLCDYPDALLPNHKNVLKGDFDDRFRVQLSNKPSTTITSHISKDGHYYIHPDPAQCRSLTVREAARLQTFPDNYYFMGSRTQQYIQVGNAVPPLLARKIAKIVADFLKEKQG